MFKNFFFFIFLILISLVVSHLDLINYGLGQAKGQLNIVQKAVPIEELLSDLSFEDSLKQKIRIINKVRQYAIDSIGLQNSTNYTTFYDQEGKVILWNLSACAPYEFTPKTWGFPFLGSFPYKGFFELEKAQLEKAKLDKLDYDTRIRPVGGWSTLGWFSDPILSNMLNRSEGGLAELIIHELTHATLFIRDDVTFNENLASFIGERGAMKFLASHYGASSPFLTDYLAQQEDEKRFVKHMLFAYDLLDERYQSIKAYPDSVKEIEKHFLIDEIIASLDTVSFHNIRYRRIFEKARPNNAYFMSFQRYHSVEDSLNHLLTHQFNNDLRAFTIGMKEYHE